MSRLDRCAVGTLRALLGWLAVAAVLVVVAVQSQPPAAAQPQQALLRGNELYATYCAQCHGADGRGAPGARAGGLRHVSVPYIDLVLRTNRMPPGDLSLDSRGLRKGRLSLSEEDREALVAYVGEAFDLPGEIPDVGEGDPTEGQLVWATHCAACHGATGAGGVAGGGAITPLVAGDDPVTVVEAIRVGPFTMPQFGPEIIGEREAADVAAFMQFIPEEPTTPLGLTELNPVFAAAFAAVMALVVVLSSVWLAGRPVYFRPSQAKQDEDSEEQAE